MSATTQAASVLATLKIREMKMRASFTIAIAASAGIAGIFLLIALTLLLSEAVGLIWACLIMAAVFVVVALLILLLRQSKLRRMKKDARAAALTAAVATATASPVGLSIAAVAAGFLMSRK